MLGHLGQFQKLSNFDFTLFTATMKTSVHKRACISRELGWHCKLWFLENQNKLITSSFKFSFDSKIVSKAKLYLNLVHVIMLSLCTAKKNHNIILCIPVSVLKALIVKYTQTVRRQQPTNCLSVFDLFEVLAVKRLKVC